MRHVNEKLLRSYLGPGNCDVCGRFCSKCCAHHVMPRSRCRIDHPFHLLRVGLDYWNDCKCHQRFESLPKDDAMALGLPILAKRDGTTVAALEDVIAVIRSMPPRPPASMVRLRLAELTGESHALASKVFRDLGLLET